VWVLRSGCAGGLGGGFGVRELGDGKVSVGFGVEMEVDDSFCVGRCLVRCGSCGGG